MKILWVNPWFGNYRVPVYDYLNKLSNHNFYLIYGKRNMTDALCEKIDSVLEDHAVCITNQPQIVFGNEDSDMANGCIRIPIPKGVFSAIKKVKPDIIIVDGFFQWAPIALLYAKMNKIPIIIDYERTCHVERNSPKWRTMYRKLLGKYVDGFVINGSLTREYLIKLGFGHKPIGVGAMAADSKGLSDAVSQIDGKLLREKLGLNKGVIYLFVGQIVERKGVVQLCQVWNNHVKKHTDDTLIVVGKGVLLDTLKSEYNIDSIKFIGHVDYSEIIKYYAVADLLIMPTLEDNWSLVVPEAMACSLPVLCSVYNGCYPELIKENVNGYIFDPLVEESLLAAMDRVHEVDLIEFGKKSKLIEADFTPDKAAHRIYEMCIKVKQNRDA